MIAHRSHRLRRTYLVGLDFEKNDRVLIGWGQHCITLFVIGLGASQETCTGMGLAPAMSGQTKKSVHDYLPLDAKAL